MDQNHPFWVPPGYDREAAINMVTTLFRDFEGGVITRECFIAWAVDAVAVEVIKGVKETTPSEDDVEGENATNGG